jgi:hypothetical protein
VSHWDAPGEHYREYRVSDSTFGWILLFSALGALAVLVEVGTDDAWSGAARFWLIVAGLAAIVLLPVYARVSATVTGADGVAIRGLLRTRRFGWPDIQDIRIEVNPAALAGYNAPRHIAVLYTTGGRRVPLPHVNERNLDRFQPSLTAEVEAIRATWLDRRGPQWAPVPSVRRMVEDRVRYQVSSWTVGAFAAMLAVPVAAVIVVVGLFTGAPDLPEPLSWPFQPESMLVLPAVVFPIATVTSKLARRRARLPADRNAG